MKNFILFIAMLCTIITTTFAQRETVEKKLKVTENFKYSATSPDSGKVLMATDAQGNSIWQSVAAIGPCCLPDTINPQYIVLPQCTTSNNRNELLIVAPNAELSSTACDTITYLFIDSLVTNYFSTNSGFNITGQPNTIAVFDTAGVLSYSSGIIYDEYKNLRIPLGNSTSPSIKADSSQIYFFVEDLYENNMVFKLGANSIYNTDRAALSINYNYCCGDAYTINLPYSKPQVGQSLKIVSEQSGNNFFALWDEQVLNASSNLNFGTISANSFEDLIVNITGADIGDVVSIGVPNISVSPGAMFFAWVSSSDNVTIRCSNVSNDSIDPDSGVFNIKLFK